MAGQRRVLELAMNEEEVVQLGAISRLVHGTREPGGARAKAAQLS
ncbi:hypothetical protein [Mesorhizobium sp.]|nr:hypothetical protein [Mesorhizobium sp.]